MVTVKFNSVEEFIDELANDKDLVDRKIVRLTNLFVLANFSPNIDHVRVVATAKVGQTIIRLDRYCGDNWHLGNNSDDATMMKAAKVQEAIKKAMAALDLEVRSGMFELAPVAASI